MTKLSKADALSYAIFAINTLQQFDASSPPDLIDLDDNSDKIIKKLAKMREKARAETLRWTVPGPSTFEALNQDHIKRATHVLHFGVIGTDPEAGAPEFLLRQGDVPISADRKRKESVLVFPRPASLPYGADIGILDIGGWPAWGEPAHDGEDTFHVSIFYDHLPTPSEAEDVHEAIGDRVNLGRMLDYACLTKKEDYSNAVGTYLFHMNEEDSAYFVPERRLHD